MYVQFIQSYEIDDGLVQCYGKNEFLRKFGNLHDKIYVYGKTVSALYTVKSGNSRKLWMITVR